MKIPPEKRPSYPQSPSASQRPAPSSASAVQRGASPQRPVPSANVAHSSSPLPQAGAASRIVTGIYRSLIVLVVLLALVIAAGTIYALVFRDADAAPLFRVSDTTPAESEVSGTISPQPPPAQTINLPARENIFTGIGRLRAVSADKPAVTIVVSIAFPYTPEDRAFSEELNAKVPEFRNTALEYFSTHRAADLRSTSEENIKAELLRRYNSLLRLGSISVLYFNDFMFID